MKMRGKRTSCSVSENEKFFLQNSNAVALTEFQKAMEGAAEDAAFKDPDDVMDYIKELRKPKNYETCKIYSGIY